MPINHAAQPLVASMPSDFNRHAVGIVFREEDGVNPRHISSAGLFSNHRPKEILQGNRAARMSISEGIGIISLNGNIFIICCARSSVGGGYLFTDVGRFLAAEDFRSSRACGA